MAEFGQVFTACENNVINCAQLTPSFCMSLDPMCINTLRGLYLLPLF